MSAIWLKLTAVLCLSCTALSGPGSGGVVWRDAGGAVTIQCRPLESGQEYLSVKKGLREEFDVLYKDGNSEKNNIDKVFRGRLQVDGEFPNIDIHIKNLTSNDTGPYWCIYMKFDKEYSRAVNVKGTGSVFLLVTAQQCEPSNNNLVLVSVLICIAALLGIITCFLIWIILKTKTKTCTTKKPRRVATNDVYEDMRGTIRR